MSAAALRASVQRGTVIGLMRDLRGIASATNSKRTYSERPAAQHLCTSSMSHNTSAPTLSPL